MSKEMQSVEGAPKKKQKKLDSNDSQRNKKRTTCTPSSNTGQNTGGWSGNFVTPKEEKLSESENVGANNGDDSDSAEGVPEEEIHKMLEDALPERFRGVPKPMLMAHLPRHEIGHKGGLFDINKMIYYPRKDLEWLDFIGIMNLTEKGVYRFEVLPVDWIMVRHISGIPIYTHRTSGVCTLSKPYFVGKGTIRHHDIPITAMPYPQALQVEKKKEIHRRIAALLSTYNNTRDNSQKGNDGTTTNASVSNQFETDIMQFNQLADHLKNTQATNTLQYPTLFQRPNFITIAAPPRLNSGGVSRAKSREWVLKTTRRNYLSLLHEYVGKVVRMRLFYKLKILENQGKLYRATTYIGGMQYGVGYGPSKRRAKSAAARKSLKILVPEIQVAPDVKEPRDNSDSDNFALFESIGIEDPRLAESSVATNEKSPYAILHTCLLRNFGQDNRQITTKTECDMELGYRKLKLTMTAGIHTATVVCEDKDVAMQRASQIILQALHPHVRSWGSLLRLYCSRSFESCTEARMEGQQKTRPTPPNNARPRPGKLRNKKTQLSK